MSQSEAQCPWLQLGPFKKSSRPFSTSFNLAKTVTDMKLHATLIATVLLLGLSTVTSPRARAAADVTTPAEPTQLPLGPSSVAQSSTPTTYMTRQGPNEIIVQITDGNFYFREVMNRGYGSTYQAIDHGIRVNYDNDTGRIVVISNETGAEFYNYFYTGSVDSAGSAPAGDYGTAPPSQNFISRVSDNEYSVELSEGQFYFNAPLYRTSGDTFVGSDGRFRVMYDRGNSRMVVINLATGEEIFNYIYSEADEGYL